MTDPRHTRTYTARTWAAVDRLTRPSTRHITRDNGHREQATVPSLWMQAVQALHNANNKTGARTGVASERTPIDLDLAALLGIIRATTRRELARLREPAPPGTTRQLRRLASVVIARDIADLWWWAYRFDSWARWLAQAVAANDHKPAPLRLRNAPCPICGTVSVLVEVEDETIVAGPILVEFRGGYVRDALCTACARVWWRGQLEDLAAQLGCATPA